MKKILAMLLALVMVFALCACGGTATPPANDQPSSQPEENSAPVADEITLDVIICEYGTNTREWFLGSGMDGTNFVDKFEKKTPASSSTLRSSPGTMSTPLLTPVLPAIRLPTSSILTFSQTTQMTVCLSPCPSTARTSFLPTSSPHLLSSPLSTACAGQFPTSPPPAQCIIM